MRIIYHKANFHVIGVIPERITSELPPSHFGEDTLHVDLDYTHEDLLTSELAQYLEANQNSLIEKVITFGADGKISFVDKPKLQFVKTILVDVQNPQLDRTVRVYTDRAITMGVIVEIDDIDTVILAKIKNKDGKEVGYIRLVKRMCCTYLYEEGEVYDREYFPHYIGFSKLIEHIKPKVKWLDLGGFVSTDEELNRFKRKWGTEEYTALV